MGKFLKRCLVIMLIWIFAGFIASKMGVLPEKLNQWEDKVLNGDWNKVEPFFELEEQTYFNKDILLYENEESVQHTFSKEGITKIYVKSSGVTVEFAEQDNENFIVESSMVHKYQIYLENGVLYIIAKAQTAPNLGKGKVKISGIFSECSDVDVKVESSASVVLFDNLKAKETELEVSAGAITWNTLSAGELDVEMAAGTINGANTMVMGETDIKVSAGVVKLEGVFGTKTEIETTAGMVEIAFTYTF